MHGLWLCFSALLFTTCGIRTEYAQSNHIVINHQSVDGRDGARRNQLCREVLSYATDPLHPDYTPVAEIRINIHFMDLETGLYNFSEERGIQFATTVINDCNDRLAHNVQMHLPLDNDTPVLPTQYQLKLTGEAGVYDDDGIYFHEDADLYYYIHGRKSNRTNRDVINKYRLQPDSVINIFFMPHHPDSVGRPQYRAVGTGIMLGGNIKIAQIFSKNPPPASCVGLLNHELGHVIGLSHTWKGRDGCDDTPKHENCFTYTNTPPCDTAVSNNMMDYNQWQHALTPCQIGKVHRAISSQSSRIRKFVDPFWCKLNPGATIYIRDSVFWYGAKDLAGDVRIEDGGVLTVGCRLSLPENARIIIAPTGKLILDNAKLHNACGHEWNGIEIHSKGKSNGQIEIIAPSSFENMQNPVVLSDS